ncbi:MAG: flagellar hook-basal body complex protein FliE, partial [Firmicutes bacterium]|nr:flagellar hook-basal body complex protein FliE [Bacillota bacterium]
MKILPVALPLQNTGAPAPKKPPTGAGDLSFQDLFDKTLESLNDKQLHANQTVEKYLTGEVQDIHTVM